MSQTNQLIQSAKQVIDIEHSAILQIKQRIDGNFARACETVLACKGRVVVTGMGKSGHIANKIAATMASTGTPAFFVHPGEANHGDLGMITSNDILLALSNSGETSELISLLPVIKRLNITLISMTGNPQSSLSQFANINLDTSVEKEACPMNLAPTASTTAALVMGDALAVALLEARGFTADDFALSHPGGSLGRRLLLKVSDIMHTEQAIPTVTTHTNISDALLEMSQKRLGMTCILDKSNQLVGIFTDGDLRRTIASEVDLHKTPITQVMTAGGLTIQADKLAAEALQVMQANSISVLVVLDDNSHLKGVLHMHDLLKAGVV